MYYFGEIHDKVNIISIQNTSLKIYSFHHVAYNQ